MVAGWNGLAVAALADAGAVLDRPEPGGAAERIAGYLERVHWRRCRRRPGTLVRVSHGGTSRGIGGLLEDYAFCADGFLALYSATGDPLVRAGRAGDRGNPGAVRGGGTLADSAGESQQVVSAQGGNRAWTFDDATPSGAAAFAGALLGYAALSGSAEHRIMAGNILGLVPPLATRAPRAAGWLLATAQAALAGPLEAAVVGPAGPERAALHRALLLSPSPGLVVAAGGRRNGRRRRCCGRMRPDAGRRCLCCGTGLPDPAGYRWCTCAAVWSADRPVATVPGRPSRPGQLRTAMRMAAKCAAKASTVKAWNSSWKPKCW